MKKTAYFLSIIASGILIITAPSSCKKYEEQPKDWFTSDLTFDSLDQNGIVAGYQLNNIYAYLPVGFDRVGGDFLDDGAGEAVPSTYNATAENYLNGTFSTLNNPDPYWGNSYFGIRGANVFLKSIDRVPVAALKNRSPVFKGLLLLGIIETIRRHSVARRFRL